jgi:hypothetical protein
MMRENEPDRPLVAIEQKLDVGPALQRNRRSRHDDGRAVIAAHRVKRYANVARHSSVRPPMGAFIGPRPARRDNSGFAAQGNA